jgi:hypothetical protein
VRGFHVPATWFLALSPSAFFDQSDFVALKAACRLRQGWRSGLVSCADPLPMFVTNRTLTEDQNLLSCFIVVGPLRGADHFFFTNHISDWWPELIKIPETLGNETLA